MYTEYRRYTLSILESEELLTSIVLFDISLAESRTKICLELLEEGVKQAEKI